jgi:hypothetical protein
LINFPKSFLNSCSDSTTATNSTLAEKTDIFTGDVICDWLSFRHDFPMENQSQPIESGKTLKLTQDGEIEWEKNDFSSIRCPSSDTSVRIKCDGRSLYFSGNIGRFGNQDNVTGINVIQCFEKACNLIKRIYPQINLSTFGTISRAGTISEYGTYLTRIDLASNFQTDCYSQIASLFASRKLFTKLPILGKYGPTWGYDTKRGQYWKAKLYDKTAEQTGKRTPNTNETIARFEIQLGATYLRKHSLNFLKNWRHDMNTENIIYGNFSNQLITKQATQDAWIDFPPILRQHAVLWREGTDPKSYLKKSQYYKVRKGLLNLGLDISRPCNIATLDRAVKYIEFKSIPTLKRVA